MTTRSMLIAIRSEIFGCQSQKPNLYVISTTNQKPICSRFDVLSWLKEKAQGAAKEVTS